LGTVRTPARVASLTFLALCVSAAPAYATDFTVTKAADSKDGSCTLADCSLREAVIAANGASPGPNRIILPARHYELTLAGGDTSGDLDVTRSLNIEGAGSDTTTIDGNSIDRVFQLTAGVDFSLSGVTLTGGDPGTFSNEGGAILGDNGVGAITLSHNVITGNHVGSGSGGYGAVIDLAGAAGILTISDSTVTSNTAGGTNSSDWGYGGVVYDVGTGQVKIERSTVTGNRAGGNGAYGYGGVAALSSNASIVDSAVEGNHAGGGGNNAFGYGGAIEAAGVEVTRSTLKDNTAGGEHFGYGGAIDAGGSVKLISVTATGNRAGGTGGDQAFGYGGAVMSNGPTVIADHSTFADNHAGGHGAYGYGGAIKGADLTLTASTVSGNSAGGGGGSMSYGNGGGANIVTATITNSTFTGNTAGGGASSYGYGGGILASGGADAAKFFWSTVTGNTAAVDGGNGAGGGVSGSGRAKSSIISGNTNASFANCDTALTDDGHNLEQGSTCGFTDPTDQHGDPKLGPLATNGGPTKTLALLAGSAAIDTGADAGCPGADQRDIARPLDGNSDGTAHCDIGAYERPALPSALTGPANPIGIVGATLTGTANPGGGLASFHFEYGKTTSYGKSSPGQALAAGTAPLGVSAAIGGLKPKTTYHYRLAVTNETGGATGADRTFKTKKDPFKGVGLRKQTVVVKNGIARVKISCSKGVPPPCKGTLALALPAVQHGLASTAKRKALKLGKGKFTIQPGKSKRVRVKLTKKARKLLAKRRKLVTRATAKARDGAGTKKTRTAKVKLKLAKKKK
jgi:CSLREA domain-containing protein